MKSLLLLTASGPLLILTSHESLHDQKLLEGLKHEGTGKFVAFEVPFVSAAGILLDRGWGKPAQPHTGEDDKASASPSGRESRAAIRIDVDQLFNGSGRRPHSAACHPVRPVR